VGVIEFTPPLYDLVRYLVQIEDVTDVAGNALAGDNNRIFTAQAGDASGDLRVNAIDLSYIWAHRTSQIDPESEEEVRSDVNRDGRVNSIDLSATWPRRGSNMQEVEDPVLDGEGGGGMSLPGQGPEGQREAGSPEGDISIDKYLIDTDLDGEADFFDYDGLLRDLGVSLLGE